jgi:hypothetical protein
MATSKKTFLRFFGRIVLTWAVALLLVIWCWDSLTHRGMPDILIPVWLIVLALFLSAGWWHYSRVQLIAGDLDHAKLANRQQRQIEIPFESTVASVIAEAAIRAVPDARDIHVLSGGLQINARVPHSGDAHGRMPLWHRLPRALGATHNLVTAILLPRENVVSMTLVCEPEGGAWTDWLVFDSGTNLIIAEQITRAIGQRIAAQRRGEQEVTRETATEKELAVAKLGLLSAQVEPHFLYNTLGSAKYLIQSDPAKAEAMLDNLILYLRNSLPRTEDAPSTLGEEVTRARAYLDILQIRMGERLQLAIDIPAELESTLFPTMILQTLVENAIKHGLEPKPEGGTIWIRALRDDGLAGGRLVVIVADDGRGLSAARDTAGTGIGLKNVRERLKLLYEGQATFNLTSNFPSGVATTITVPMRGPVEAAQTGASA